LDGLYFPDGEGEAILAQIQVALQTDKHLILTGPPGTGKTEIVHRVSEYLEADYPYLFSGSQMTTATADWSTFDTVDEITGGSLVETQGGEYILDVEAAGEWTIYVAQPESPGQEVRTPPVSVEGEDSAIVGPIDADSGLTVAGEHQDEDREYSFDVRVVSEDATDILDGDFAFTEDAGFSGEARVDVDGVSWAAVRTFGPWSLEFND